MPTNRPSALIVQTSVVEGNTQQSETSNPNRRAALSVIFGGLAAAASPAALAGPLDPADDPTRELVFLADVLERLAELEPNRAAMGDEERRFFDEVDWRMSQLAAKYVTEKDPAKLGPNDRAALERLKAIISRTFAAFIAGGVPE